jgi:hypothetical protein
MIDFDKAATLLHIADKAKQWPRLKPLHDAAMVELEAMQVPEPQPEPEPEGESDVNQGRR